VLAAEGIPNPEASHGLTVDSHRTGTASRRLSRRYSSTSNGPLFPIDAFRVKMLALHARQELHIHLPKLELVM